MIVAAFFALATGAALSWHGPHDPEYAIDWLVWALGLFLGLWGLWYLTKLWLL